MTLTKALVDSGLLTEKDSKVSEMKKLTMADREWFKDRFRIEYGYVFEGD